MNTHGYSGMSAAVTSCIHNTAPNSMTKAADGADERPDRGVQDVIVVVLCMCHFAGPLIL